MPNLSGPYQQIKAKIKADCPSIQFVSMWNNQMRDLHNEKTWNFPLPAVFIEFTKPSKVGVLGNGWRIFEPLFVRVHVIREFYNATASIDFMEEDPGAFDLMQEVYQGLSGYEPDGCVAMFSYSEEMDYDHDNLLHLILTFQTNYIDSSMNRPVNGIPWLPPKDLEIIVNPWEDGIILQNNNGPLITDQDGYFLW